MRWRFSIVRTCDLFWFGVTANISRDPATFIAIDPKTWMVSDEGFCLEHCRRAPPLPSPLPALRVHHKQRLQRTYIATPRVQAICAAQACQAGPPKTRRIIVLEQEYFCVDGLHNTGEYWQDVVMDLDTCLGTLAFQINGGASQRVFEGLPTQRRLYPCVMANNKGQLIFELLDAEMLS